MSANADPDPYATIERVRFVIDTLRSTADEMERQHPDDLVARAQNTGARTAVDIIEAALNNTMGALARERGVRIPGQES